MNTQKIVGVVLRIIGVLICAASVMLAVALFQTVNLGLPQLTMFDHSFYTDLGYSVIPSLVPMIVLGVCFILHDKIPAGAAAVIIAVVGVLGFFCENGYSLAADIAESLHSYDISTVPVDAIQWMSWINIDLIYALCFVGAGLYLYAFDLRIKAERRRYTVLDRNQVALDADKVGQKTLLEFIEEKYRDGEMSDAEYDAKRAEILGRF